MKNSSSEKSADEARLDGQRMGKKVAIGSGKVGAQCPNPWNANSHLLSTYSSQGEVENHAVRDSSSVVAAGNASRRLTRDGDASRRLPLTDGAKF